MRSKAYMRISVFKINLFEESYIIDRRTTPIRNIYTSQDRKSMHALDICVPNIYDL